VSLLGLANLRIDPHLPTLNDLLLVLGSWLVRLSTGVEPATSVSLSERASA